MNVTHRADRYTKTYGRVYLGRVYLDWVYHGRVYCSVWPLVRVALLPPRWFPVGGGGKMYVLVQFDASLCPKGMGAQKCSV